MLTYQKQQHLNYSFCCVPRCSVSGRFNSSVSSHQFPKDESVRAISVRNIRRDNFVVRRHTTVCSRHFMPEDIIEGGRYRLNPEAILVLFAWNNYSLRVARPSVWQRTQRQEEDEGVVPMMPACLWGVTTMIADQNLHLWTWPTKKFTHSSKSS